jgi:hypothetical protein
LDKYRTRQRGETVSSLKFLARPTGIEPVFSP